MNMNMNGSETIGDKYSKYKVRELSLNGKSTFLNTLFMWSVE